MAAATATARPPTAAGPATNGKAYPIEDHTYDVVVVGAGGAGLRAVVGCSRSRPAHRLHHKGVPDPLAYGRSARRHFGVARQHASGRLALAHVRHRQGVGLARRPGRDRIHGAQRARSRLRARALGRAVLAHRGRQDLPAPVRRHDAWTTARARRSAPAPPPTAPATPCCTRCTARRCATRPNSTSSSSPST